MLAQKTPVRALVAAFSFFTTTSTLPAFIQITNVGGQVITDSSTGIDGDGNFDISGNTHFEWIDMEVDNLSDPSAGSVIVHRHAYSTASDSATGIPEPTLFSFAVLAFLSLLLRRSRRI